MDRGGTQCGGNRGLQSGGPPATGLRPVLKGHIGDGQEIRHGTADEDKGETHPVKAIYLGLLQAVGEDQQSVSVVLFYQATRRVKRTGSLLYGVDKYNLAVLAGPDLYAAQEGREELAADFRKEQSDSTGAPAGQTAGSGAGDILEFGDGSPYRWAVVSVTLEVPFTTRLTVAMETPARRATSAMIARLGATSSIAESPKREGSGI